MSERRRQAEQRGRQGEELAAWWLRLQGWRILARRARVAGLGEVDLVVRRGRTVAFIEVKWRATAEELDMAIDERRLRRVARAAEGLAATFAGPEDDVRIDVVLVAPRRLPKVIENAWMPHT